MRILLVTHRYPPLGIAGVERLSEQTARTLTGSGHEVTVLTRDETSMSEGPRLLRTRRAGVPVQIIEGGGPSHGRFPRLAPALDRLFERVLIEVNPDVVLLSHLLGHSPSYLAIAHRWGVPVVMELHDFYVACERAHLQRFSGERCVGPEGGRACATHCFPQGARALERWALRSHLFRRALEQADALVCPSSFVEQYFREHFGPGLPPIHVIGNGVDFEGFAPSLPDVDRRELHLAFIGVVAEHKGVHVVLDALRLARLPASRLTLIGDVSPPYLRSLRRMSDKIDNFELRAYGRFEPAELPWLLADVDAVIVPSIVWETYSIVAREAFACGVPVIASRLGALTEAIRHGENGLLFEPGFPLDLATNLQLLASDPAHLRSLRDGIRATDWMSVKERTLRLERLLLDLGTGVQLADPKASELEELSILRDGLLEQQLSSHG